MLKIRTKLKESVIKNIKAYKDNTYNISNLLSKTILNNKKSA